MSSSPFGIREDQRVAVFIDGPSFYSVAKSNGFEVDYRKLREHFDEHSNLYRIFYFTGLTQNPDEHSPVVKLVDWLSYNGFRTITKPLREYTDADGRRRVKGNTQVEFAVEMLAAVPFCDHMVLFSGDGDLSYVVDEVQRRGTKVTVVSSANLGQSSISDELRRVADWFVDVREAKSVMLKHDIRPDFRESIGSSDVKVMPAPLKTAGQAYRSWATDR